MTTPALYRVEFGPAWPVPRITVDYSDPNQAARTPGTEPEETPMSTDLPHDLYLTQVYLALHDVGLEPDHHTFDDCDTRGTHRYLRGILHHPPYRRWPHGLLLIWEWHTGIEADQGEPERGPVWLWAALRPDGSNGEPASLPVDGYANPTQVAASFGELVETGSALKRRPGRWWGADALDADCVAWGAEEAGQ